MNTTSATITPKGEGGSATEIQPDTTSREESTPPTVAPGPAAPMPVPETVPIGFGDSNGFAVAQRVASAFARSTLVPSDYRNNVANCLVAMNMAHRLGADPLMVMQNLYIVHGRPAWSSQFMISLFNKTDRFSSMRFEWRGEEGKESRACRAYAIENDSGDRLNGTWITWQMVRADGWLDRKGSKWKTMPEQMFIYRAAAFFVRVHAPEMTMGLQTFEEVRDVLDTEIVDSPPTPTRTKTSQTLDDLTGNDQPSLSPLPEGMGEETKPPAETQAPERAATPLSDEEHAARSDCAAAIEEIGSSGGKNAEAIAKEIEQTLAKHGASCVDDLALEPVRDLFKRIDALI